MRNYLLSEKGTFYKANLHCHSVISDGNRTPEELKAEYMAQGYSIVAFTDHDVMIPHPELCDERFLALEGYEIEIEEYDERPFKYKNACHICLIALKENLKQVCHHREKYIQKGAVHHRHRVKFDETLPDFERVYCPECINEIIKKGVEGGFFVTYNHPGWSIESYPAYMAYHGMHAMEIVNYSSAVGGYTEYNDRVFDDMLRGGKRVYCSACDDNHNFGEPGTLGYDSFGGFNMIKASSLTLPDVADALLKGQFYASEGPLIHELYVEDGEVHIKCSPAKKIEIKKGVRENRSAHASLDRNGKLIPITEAHFPIDPTDEFFRLVVTDEYGKHANTQAYDPVTLDIANSNA